MFDPRSQYGAQMLHVLRNTPVIQCCREGLVSFGRFRMPPSSHQDSSVVIRLDRRKYRSYIAQCSRISGQQDAGQEGTISIACDSSILQILHTVAAWKPTGVHGGATVLYTKRTL